MINDGGPAFPCAINDCPDVGYQCRYAGMTLRDWFAGMALQGLLSKLPVVDMEGEIGKVVADKEKYNREVSESCYAFADAMIAAREAHDAEHSATE